MALLSYFLFQRIKFGRAEKLAKSDFQTVAQLFDGHGAWVIALPIENAFDRSLWDCGDIAQRIGRDPPLLTKLPDPVCDRFSGRHALRLR